MSFRTIIETDPSIMTAPQLSVDTVSESVYKDSVLQEKGTVNRKYMGQSQIFLKK